MIRRSGNDEALLGADRSDLLSIHAFCSLMARAFRKTARTGFLRVGDGAVTGAAFSVLEALGLRGPLMMTDIARELSVDQSAASRQVRQVESAGLVSRTRDPDDARVSMFELTEQGRHALDDGMQRILAVYATAMRDWSDADRATLAGLMQRFRDGFEEAGRNARSRVAGRDADEAARD